jgi:hypothetical protein
MQERRKVPRQRALKGAKLLLGKLSVFDCVVRNISDAGAGVELPYTLDVPDKIDIRFFGNASMRHCRCAWRKLSKMGVEFI